MIQIILSVAKQRIPTMSDSELAQACGEVQRLSDFDMLNVVNGDDVNELFELLGMEVEKRTLHQRAPRDPASRTRKTD
jgi:hypothetical protein